MWLSALIIWSQHYWHSCTLDRNSFSWSGTWNLLLNANSAADRDQAGMWAGGLRRLHHHAVGLFSGLWHNTVTILSTALWLWAQWLWHLMQRQKVCMHREILFPCNVCCIWHSFQMVRGWVLVVFLKYSPAYPLPTPTGVGCGGILESLCPFVHMSLCPCVRFGHSTVSNQTWYDDVLSIDRVPCRKIG